MKNKEKEILSLEQQLGPIKKALIAKKLEKINLGEQINENPSDEDKSRLKQLTTDINNLKKQELLIEKQIVDIKYSDDVYTTNESITIETNYSDNVKIDNIQITNESIENNTSTNRSFPKENSSFDFAPKLRQGISTRVNQYMASPDSKDILLLKDGKVREHAEGFVSKIIFEMARNMPLVGDVIEWSHVTALANNLKRSTDVMQMVGTKADPSNGNSMEAFAIALAKKLCDKHQRSIDGLLNKEGVEIFTSKLEKFDLDRLPPVKFWNQSILRKGDLRYDQEAEMINWILKNLDYLALQKPGFFEDAWNQSGSLDNFLDCVVTEITKTQGNHIHKQKIFVPSAYSKLEDPTGTQIWLKQGFQKFFSNTSPEPKKLSFSEKDIPVEKEQAAEKQFNQFFKKLSEIAQSFKKPLLSRVEMTKCLVFSQSEKNALPELKEGKFPKAMKGLLCYLASHEGKSLSHVDKMGLIIQVLEKLQRENPTSSLSSAWCGPILESIEKMSKVEVEGSYNLFDQKLNVKGYIENLNVNYRREKPKQEKIFERTENFSFEDIKKYNEENFPQSSRFIGKEAKINIKDDYNPKIDRNNNQFFADENVVEQVVDNADSLKNGM